MTLVSRCRLRMPATAALYAQQKGCDHDGVWQWLGVRSCSGSCRETSGFEEALLGALHDMSEGTGQ